MRLAFMGFRHGHVMPLYKAAAHDPRIEVVAACEEHAPTAVAAAGVKVTHRDFAAMLRDVAFDALAVSDYFARRGSIAIAALEAGKHVILDKPICTDLRELDQIERLAMDKHLAVGCLLDLRDSGALRAARRVIRDGAIGDVHTVNFTAQHPLFFGHRAGWYFEEGKHGGTLNDIAIHAIDLIPWLTGRRIVECVAARAWNARLPQHPHFQDAAQLMLRLDNDAGVLGDVSYLAPDGLKYSAPQYWRITCHGSGGMIETKLGASSVMLAKTSDSSPQTIPADAELTHGPLESFLTQIGGESTEGSGITTRDVLTASRQALLIQLAADQGRTRVPL
jgi:predicted dehydrogenase